MQPKLYSVTEHQISPDKVDTHAFYVIQKLKEAGHKAYLVGGGVRDLLLQQRPKDFDVSTSAKPEEIRHLFRNSILIGRRFRLAHVRFGRKVIEVSTFRSGDTENAGLIVRDNVWGTEEQDVLRRDFTINGLFYDPENQVVIDYVEGYPDIERRILRTIGQPEIRFIQDPVRMIRLIKFCARFQFEIDGPTFQALLSCRGEIIKSSSARIFEELLRMLESGSSKSFFHLLHEYGLLRSLMPQFDEAMEKFAKEMTYRLMEEVDSEVKKTYPESIDRSLLLSALLFPMFDFLVKKKAVKHLPHLGQIAELAHRVLDDVFLPFFNVPRRMRAIVSSILTSQYRLIPLEEKPHQRRLRAPRDPSFHLALHLLKLRAAAETTLLPTYMEWTEAVFASSEGEPPLHHPSEEPRRRRRRRRRKRASDAPETQ